MNNQVTAAEPTGSIIVDGQVITYNVELNKITYSDGKIAYPSIASTDFVKAYATAIAPPVDPVFVNVGTGSGQLFLEPLTNVNIKIVPGDYSYIYLPKATNVKIDATGVNLPGGSIDIGQADNLEFWGVSVSNQAFRAISIEEHSNNVYFHDMSFKNIGDYTISYHNEGVYDGTDQTASINWKMERLTFENTSTGFFCRGALTDAGITNLMKNFKFLNCVIKNCPEIGNVVWMGNVEGYEISGNKIDNINRTFSDPNAPNGYHNGIFQMRGNGSFHGNKITNHQGNAIRAWGMSYGAEVKDILIYNNVVWNSWKYGAFELQVTPEIETYLAQYPSRIKPTNAKVYNNTAGHLNTSHDWDGVMLDLYQTQGTLEYYNNLGFEMYKQDPVYHPIANMINMSGSPVIRDENNHYFATQQEAVVDTVNFVSLLSGVGAL